MQETKEITALFTLIDDPDEEVFSTVSERITNYGTNIIPNLESLWETTLREEVQERIEMLIHKLHYKDLTYDLQQWNNSAYNDLLFGTLLIAKFQYPDLQTTPVLQEIEKIRRNIWLELNSFLTPLEQANVLTSIVYNYYNLKGIEINYGNPDDFLLHKVLQSKRGNALSNGILYLVLAALLDIPVKAINIPKHFVLAFFKPDFDATLHKSNAQKHILFYVDATTGQVFSHKEIELYFKRISVPPAPFYFRPLSNKRIVQLLIEELAKCFTDAHVLYKQEELLRLAALLD